MICRRLVLDKVGPWEKGRELEGEGRLEQMQTGLLYLTYDREQSMEFNQQ